MTQDFLNLNPSYGTFNLNITLHLVVVAFELAKHYHSEHNSSLERLYGREDLRHGKVQARQRPLCQEIQPDDTRHGKTP